MVTRFRGVDPRQCLSGQDSPTGLFGLAAVQAKPLPGSKTRSRLHDRQRVRIPAVQVPTHFVVVFLTCFSRSIQLDSSGNGSRRLTVWSASCIRAVLGVGVKSSS